MYVYVGAESDSPCHCFVILMICGDLWYCYFFIKHCFHCETKKGEKVFVFLMRIYFFFFKTAFYFLSFLPSHEIQE